MNNYTLAIASFIRFDVALFNTLEYAMKKDKYEVNAYLARKEMINTEITQNTPQNYEDRNHYKNVRRWR